MRRLLLGTVPCKRASGLRLDQQRQAVSRPQRQARDQIDAVAWRRLEAEAAGEHRCRANVSVRGDPAVLPVFVLVILWRISGAVAINYPTSGQEVRYLKRKSVYLFQVQAPISVGIVY